MKVHAFLATAILFSFTATALAQPLIHVNGALEVFDAQGMENSPQWVRIWVFFMLTSFACSFFRLETRTCSMGIGWFCIRRYSNDDSQLDV